MKKLIQLGNQIVDANQILAMGVNSVTSLGPTNQIKITFKARKEYIFNPNTELYELEEFNDILYVDFYDYESAEAHLLEWRDEWEAMMEEIEKD